MTWLKKLRGEVPGHVDPACDHTNASAIESADRLIKAGNALEDSGDFAAAIELYRGAALVVPSYARVQINLGNALAKVQRTGEAEAAYREAIRIQPELATAYFNLASLFTSRGDPAGAESLLRDALRIDPALAEAEVSLALILAANGHEAEAEVHLRRALALRPNYAGAAFNLGQMLVQSDRFEEAIDALALASEEATDTDSSMLFALNSRPDLDQARVFDLHLRIGATIARRAGHSYTSWSNVPDPDRRLCVGYVSGDFRAHPVGMLMKPVLEHHDGRSVDVRCYANNIDSDAITDTLRRAVRNWHDVTSLSHDEFAELVREHDVDILVDLSGHTNRNRLLTFARHPAPVQATWLGYLNTSGLTSMDFRICDNYTNPPGETDAYYIERLVRLPHSQWCYEPWLAPGEFRREAGSAATIRFGSVNNLMKISDACADLWAQILRDEPGSELTILDVPLEQRDRLLARFATRGIDRSRITLRGRLPLTDYYSAIGSLDVALDTFPYNGGTTTLDTIWMGTPLIAMKGNRSISRSAFSIMSTLGLRELIAETSEEYVAKNLRLARDPAWRLHLRESLRERLRASPLMRTDAFVADLEHCYKQMWYSWCTARQWRV